MAPIVWLLGALLGILAVLVGWGLWRVTGQPGGQAQGGTRDALLIGLLMLACLAAGVFVAYVLLGSGAW